MMRVYELAQNLGRTEEQMLDDLDAIGFAARDGQVDVPPNIVLLLIMRERRGSSSPPTSSEALVTAPAEWAILQSPDQAQKAVIVRYTVEESPRILATLTEWELSTGSVPHAGNLSATIVDHLVKAVPLVATGLEVGQVFKVVGTSGLVEGLANGSMSLMSTSGGSLGTVVSNSTGRITGQLRFAQASAAPFMAPLLAFQVFQALAGTMQLNRINARLDTMQRSLERIAIRQEADVLGKSNQAIRMLEDLLQERQNTGTFSPDILTRLALVEETIGSIVERNKILVDHLKHRIDALKQTLGKAGAAQVTTFASEEWGQAIQDMRLLIATMQADYRITEARIYYALEHAPADVERRLENARTKSMEYRGIVASVPLLGDLQQHARACIDEMSWWERNVTARGVVKDALRLSSVQHEKTTDSQCARTSAPSSYVFWKDEAGNVHIKLLTE